MNKAQYALMITLFFSMGQGQSHYTRTSIDKILANLLKYHDIKIKRCWLFRNLRALLDAGFIRRRARYRHDTSGLISQIPSMITFPLRGVVWLSKMGISGARTLYKTMLEYLKKDDGRWPHKDDFEDGSLISEDPKTRERLTKLLGLVGTRI